MGNKLTICRSCLDDVPCWSSGTKTSSNTSGLNIGQGQRIEMDSLDSDCELKVEKSVGNSSMTQPPEISFWVELQDLATGKPYYFNRKTKVTQWQMPKEFESAVKRAQESQELEADWVEAQTKDGRVYWYDRISRQTSWGKPAALVALNRRKKKSTRTKLGRRKKTITRAHSVKRYDGSNPTNCARRSTVVKTQHNDSMRIAKTDDASVSKQNGTSSEAATQAPIPKGLSLDVNLADINLDDDVADGELPSGEPVVNSTKGNFANIPDLGERNNAHEESRVVTVEEKEPIDTDSDRVKGGHVEESKEESDNDVDRIMEESMETGQIPVAKQRKDSAVESGPGVESLALA